MLNHCNASDKEFGYCQNHDDDVEDDDEENDDDDDYNDDENYDFFNRNRPVNLSHNLKLALGLGTTHHPVQIDGEWKAPMHHGLSNSSPIIAHRTLCARHY